jgi:hypothetical protein
MVTKRVITRDVNLILSCFYVYCAISKPEDRPLWNLVKNYADYILKIWEKEPKKRWTFKKIQRLKTKATRRCHLFCFMLRFNFVSHLKKDVQSNMLYRSTCMKKYQFRNLIVPEFPYIAKQLNHFDWLVVDIPSHNQAYCRCPLLNFTIYTNFCNWDQVVAFITV